MSLINDIFLSLRSSNSLANGKLIEFREISSQLQHVL